MPLETTAATQQQHEQQQQHREEDARRRHRSQLSLHFRSLRQQFTAPFCCPQQKLQLLNVVAYTVEQRVYVLYM